MNNKQFFIMLHSGVAGVVWGTMAALTKQILPALLGALISVGIIVVAHRLAKVDK